MKKIIFTTIFSMTVIFSLNGAHAGGLSCVDLDVAIVALSGVLDDLEEDTILEGSHYDHELQDVAETAIHFAEVEGDKTLHKYAIGMMKGWQTKNAGRYIANGDAIIKRYDGLSNRDC